jgi:hypothetical protein
MIPRIRSRRGFATIMALTLLALVGVAIAALSVSFAADARRSANAAADAQLRQLLLTGCAAAREQLDHGGKVTVPLPNELTSAGAALNVSIDPPNADVRRAHIDAALGRRHAWQIVTFQRQASRWVVMSAALGD